MDAPTASVLREVVADEVAEALGADWAFGKSEAYGNVVFTTYEGRVWRLDVIGPASEA